jgi:SagB-type dehydrogenase family enzyme
MMAQASAGTVQPSVGLAYLPIGDGPPNLSGVDWSSAPTPFKQYGSAPRVKLPNLSAEMTALKSLSQFFSETAGLTRQRFKIPEPNSEPDNLSTSKSVRRITLDLLRSIPSGGALHPYELYMVVRQDDEMPDGLYHYNALEHSLESLIGTDVSAHLAQAIGIQDVATKSLILTCCFSRNAFKYQDFGYRVQGVDLGIVIGQGQLAALRQGWATQVYYQFDDEGLDQLLGLNLDLEATYAVIELGDRRVKVGTPNAVPKPTQPDSRLPFSIDRWKHLKELHLAARQPFLKDKVDRCLKQIVSSPQIQLPTVSSQPTSLEMIGQRQSAMHAFAFQELSLEQAALLFQTANGYLNDTLKDSHSALYGVVNAVSGLSRGVYRYEPKTHSLELIRDGDLRSALHNTFGGPSHNAFEISIGFFVVGNFVAGLESGGDRWYRLQNMDAGVIVARLYRAASSLGLACHANLNYKLHIANQVLGLRTPWTSLIQVLVGGVAPNGRKLDMSLVLTKGTLR